MEIPQRFPVRERWRVPGWVLALRSEVGPVRRRLEDAWTVVPDASWEGRPAVVAAVFDGLGGEPNGQEAAWEAARRLPAAIASARDPASALLRVNEWVRATGGLTTAIVVVAPRGGPVLVAGAGDSGVYARVGDRTQLLLEKDVGPEGSVARALGQPGLELRSATLDVTPGASLLLCTDGVDEVAGGASVAAALAWPDASDALERLAADVHAAGCPDNATAILMRRTE